MFPDGKSTSAKIGVAPVLQHELLLCVFVRAQNSSPALKSLAKQDKCNPAVQ